MSNSFQSDISSINYRSFQEGSLQHKENHWAKRQKEFEDHSKQLALQKLSRTYQSESSDKFKYRSIRVSQKDAPVEELRMLLHLGQEEIQDFSSALSLERKKSYEIEAQLNTYKDRCEDLERTNRSLTTLLVEKDNLVSRYLNELTQIKNMKVNANYRGGIKEIAQSVMAEDEDISEE